MEVNCVSELKILGFMVEVVGFIEDMLGFSIWHGLFK